RVAAALRYLSHRLGLLDVERDEAVALVTVAEGHASVHGPERVHHAASLSETVEAFRLFRKPFVDELAVLARRRWLDTREATALLVDAESALDRLLVALMTGHAGRAKQV